MERQSDGEKERQKRTAQVAGWPAPSPRLSFSPSLHLLASADRGGVQMTAAEALTLGREALLMVLIVSAPIMGIGLVVGLIISLFQSMTQLQEQTLSFVPKIVAMVGVSLILIPWLTERLMEYTTTMLGESPF
jgi:flagellar biosynthesis protein FliQ